MALGWNEIKERALQFSKEWADTKSEEAEAKSFLEAFFNVFGISRKRVATFEYRVKKLDETDGYIDLLWKGMILVEMKSRGKNLDKAYTQAIEYTQRLKEYELPKFILVSDFNTFRLYDLEADNSIQFTINDLVKHIQPFGFIAGYIKHTYKEQDPVNIKAAELMGKLHDRLKDIGYSGHPLEVYLVRILFCLFAENTTIFEKHQFEEFIEERTNEDGSDLAAKMQELFQVLETPTEKRFKNLDEQLNDFPYVNGKLFEETLPMASFDAKMRKSLLECCHIDWAKISPAIFGSMFQSVMNPDERRNLGAHYTSEKNILKLIRPLFLDELWKEFESIKDSKNKLREFHYKISKLKFLDPACGCGNFLIITYRELRLLEIAVLKAIQKGQQVTDIKHLLLLDVDQFYGIEYEEFPTRIAEVAMWLMDHQMNMLCWNIFGKYFTRLPLQKAATIVNGNALQIDWQRLLNKENVYTISADFANIIKVKEPIEHYKKVNVYTKDYIETTEDKLKKEQNPLFKFDYILGNPPFVGYKLQNAQQKIDLEKVFNNIKGTGVLDYVCAWYIKAAQYIQGTKIRVAFVSTNSISQGEQVGILWNILFNKYKINIHFAHRTFRWSNEAKGNAAVHVIIIGFANYNTNNKAIFEYADIKGEPHEVKVKNINPYLIDAKDILIEKRRTPISKNIPNIDYGSEPREGGYLILSNKERTELIDRYPSYEKYIKRFVSSEDFINNNIRWCFWFVKANPEEILKSNEVKERLNNVKNFRKKSLQKQAIITAETPYLFTSIRQPVSDYLLIPIVSSENRKYIPIGYLKQDIIASNACFTMPNAKLYHFGVLTSSMHISWVKYTCGRLKSDYRYSNTIVYNNYPWPENPNEKQIKAIETAAQKVLDIRAEYASNSLADLYNILTMPETLVKAHKDLDKSVDLAYRSQPFLNETNRMEFLFELYEKYTAGLFVNKKENRK